MTVVHYDTVAQHIGMAAVGSRHEVDGSHQTLDLPLAGTGKSMPTSPPVFGGSCVWTSLCTVQGRPSSLQELFASPINRTVCVL